MNTIPDALADVERAFKHLEFAIKLMCYAEADHIDREKFDTDVTLLLEAENVGFPASTFQSLDSLVLAAQANVGISFGVSAIVLDAAFEAAGISRKPESNAPADLLRTLVFYDSQRLCTQSRNAMLGSARSLSTNAHSFT
ncbi:MAG: hypothetical protein PHQ60_05495 [Sideroxydans sp.]|nr:hypothetical protein [Sideroxydans sp.]